MSRGKSATNVSQVLHGLTRLRTVVIIAGVSLVVACAPAAAPTPTSAPAKPAPTAAPAKPAEAKPAEAKPAASPAAKPAEAKPAEKPAAKPAAPAKVVPWRRGEIAPTVPLGFLLMDVKKGFDREEGLQTELTQANSAEQLRALVADRLDIADITPPVGYAAIETGAPMKMLGLVIPKVRDFLYVKKEINSVRDLVGKRIGVQAPATQSDVLVRSILTKNGINPSQVTLVGIGGDADRIAALLAGQVDATVGGVENLPVIERDPNLKPLVNLGNEMPDVMGGGLFALEKTIQEKPDVLLRSMRSIARGIRYGLDHLDEAAALAMEQLKSDPKDKPVIDTAVKAHRDFKLVNPDLGFTDQQIKGTQELAMQVGQQKAVLPPERLANLDLQKRLIAELGGYKW